MNSTQENRKMRSWTAGAALVLALGLALPLSSWAEPRIQSVTGVQQGGTDVVRIQLSEPLKTAPAGFAVPYVHVDPGFNPADTTRRMGGPYDDVLADKLYKVSWPALSLNPQGTGPYTISLDNTFGYVAGQQVTFFYGSNTSQVLVFPATGAGMKLPQTRKLLGRGDKLVLKWDQSAATWVEELYEISSSQLVLSGSATYDAPSIAAGASASTTVTVTGAALGDYVERISLGASAAGLTVTGYVSAANTVAVVLANMTGAAVDLPSTTLAAEVRKKV